MVPGEKTLLRFRPRVVGPDQEFDQRFLFGLYRAVLAGFRLVKSWKKRGHEKELRRVT